MIKGIGQNKKLSLVFVNYRSIFHLSRALQSLRQDPYFQNNTDIIVVNQDESEGAALQMLSQKQGFRLIQRENLGFASGANAGATLARGSILGFLNPDVLYRSGSLRAVIECLEKNESVGVVGARLFDAGGVEEPWSRGLFATFFRLIGSNIPPRGFFMSKGHIDWVSGGAFFIRKDVFNSLGGFDEGFFLYFEDMDLCKRAKDLGLSTRNMEGLSFFHGGGKSFSSRQIQKKHYKESQCRYFKKHRPFWEWWGVRLGYLLKSLFHIW